MQSNVTENLVQINERETARDRRLQTARKYRLNL